ncbi:hypothetical protein DYB25_006572 [Aphanomyces astaci]|uniref:mitogen-activated protein kinase kinase n=1 Tax=Aphanomyces astaci TaxID=112090 RepID=A0A397BQ68_APHAT|nr:hypothetical protein DYB25_006572 [Aphanomyces astaci]
MLVQSVHVIKFVNTVEKGKKATIYVAEVDDGQKTWTVDIRYSKFHEFHHALMKTDRNVVGKLPFPNKDLFSNQSPNHRQKELNKFVSQLLPLFQSLSMAAQIAFFELMEVPKHEFHATLVDTKDTSQPQTTVDVPEKRVSKQSISSTTTTELDDDNQRESLSDLSEQHIVEPLSPVASSRSAASPRHDPSEAETVDIPNNSNELLQVAVHHVDAVSERIFHDVQGDPSTEDDVSSSTNDTEVLTETAEASGSIASMERKPDPPSIFPDVDVRSLRLAEVRSWVCPSVKSPPPSTTEPQVLATTPPIPPPTENLHLLEKHLDDAIEAMRIELSLDTGVMSKDGREVAPSNLLLPSHTAAANPVSTLGTSSSSLRKEGAVGGNGLTIMSSSTPTSSSVATASPHTPSPLPQAPASTPKKRFSLRLQLDDMPTPQQAENRANRAANRLLASRDAMDSTDTGPVSGMQKAMLAFRLSNHSGSDNDPSSPHDGGELGRFSNGSSYSPNHGRFTTQNVLVSEAGIASPDSSCLHLQENVVQVREVGRGASGVVYKAVHLPTLKVVAIKVQCPPMSLPSPYIVSFYDAYVDKQKNCISLVMEYMGVGSLQDVVLKCGGIAEPLVARIAASVLRGLQHIHGNRMVHRDIKPHNLLLNHQGDIKISDFGLARTLNDNVTQTKTFVGTLLYMAPERIGGGDYA